MAGQTTHFGFTSSKADALLLFMPRFARPGMIVAVHSSLQLPPSSTNLQATAANHQAVNRYAYGGQPCFPATNSITVCGSCAKVTSRGRRGKVP